MSTGKLVNLATKLVVAYKEIPYSSLRVFLTEKTAQFPRDRVLQHMGAIIEKRADQQPFGSIYVKDIDSLIGELSSFGSPDLARRLFSAYLTVADGGPKPSISRETFIEDNRDLKEIKNSVKQPEVESPKRIGEVPVNKIMSDFKASRSYDRKTIADGANVVNRAITAAFGTVPSSVVFDSDMEDGIMYNAVVVTNKGRVDIQVPLEKGSFGLHTPDTFIHTADGIRLKLALNERSANGFLTANQEDKSAKYNPDFIKSSYPELHAAVLNRAAEKDYRGAEEAIDLIQQKYPTMAKAALDDYQSVLMLFAKAESKHTCMSCPFYEPAGDKTASIKDFCNKLRKPVNIIVKSADHNCTLVSGEAKKAVAGFLGTVSSSRVRFS